MAKPRRPRLRKEKGSKRVTYELIKPDSAIGQPMYALLREIVDAHHDDISSKARIGIAWCTSWRPDIDGRVTIGRCKRMTDLDREVAEYDFLILLSRGFWQDTRVTPEQRRALLDHELCHAAVKHDDRTGDPVKDERGRYVFRTRKHDVEEFSDIMRRHGTYKRDLEDFARAIREATIRDGFKPCDKCADSPGYIATSMADGSPAVTRCECWKAWNERRQLALAAA